MDNLHLDLDTQMSILENEWRQVYEASIEARADYQSLAADRRATTEILDLARERLDRADAVKSRTMVKIERLESTLLWKRLIHAGSHEAGRKGLLQR